jgi:hypothetical protein
LLKRDCSFASFAPYLSHIPLGVLLKCKRLFAWSVVGGAIVLEIGGTDVTSLSVSQAAILLTEKAGNTIHLGLKVSDVVQNHVPFTGSGCSFFALSLSWYFGQGRTLPHFNHVYSPTIHFGV